MVGDDGADLAEVPSARISRMRAMCGRNRVHIASSTTRPSSLGRRDDRFGLRLVEGERLLDEHVLARLEGQQGLCGVERVRRRDVDDVDLGVGDEGLVARWTFGTSNFSANAVAVSDAAGADRLHGEPGEDEVVGECLGDAARPENAQRSPVVVTGLDYWRPRLGGHL